MISSEPFYRSAMWLRAHGGRHHQMAMAAAHESGTSTSPR
jgi:hypothetical protein